MTTIDESTADAIRRLVDRIGEASAAEALRIAPQTMMRALAGFPCRRATVLAVRARLDTIPSLDRDAQ